MKQLVAFFLSWLLAVLFSAIGLINCFVGNDPEFGVFILLLSLLFYPPLRLVFEQKTGWIIRTTVLLILGAFIFWTSIGVGELLYKIKMILG